MRRKFLVILPFFLLAAGCNNSSQVSQLQQENAQLQTKLDNQQQENSFNLQSQCSDAADKWFVKNGYAKNQSVGTGYVSHWNKSLQKCFIEFSYEDANYSFGYDNMSYTLLDVLESKQYAEESWNKVTSLDGKKLLDCELYPNGDQSNIQVCKSQTEFDNYVKPFMDN